MYAFCLATCIIYIILYAVPLVDCEGEPVRLANERWLMYSCPIYVMSLAPPSKFQNDEKEQKPSHNIILVSSTSILLLPQHLCGALSHLFLTLYQHIY